MERTQGSCQSRLLFCPILLLTFVSVFLFLCVLWHGLDREWAGEGPVGWKTWERGAGAAAETNGWSVLVTYLTVGKKYHGPTHSTGLKKQRCGPRLTRYNLLHPFPKRVRVFPNGLVHHSSRLSAWIQRKKGRKKKFRSWVQFMLHVCALQSRDWPISEWKKGPARTQSEWTALKPPSSLPVANSNVAKKKWNWTRESFFFIALFFNWQCQEFYCALPTCSSQKTHTNDTKQTNYWLHTHLKVAFPGQR